MEMLERERRKVVRQLLSSDIGMGAVEGVEEEEGPKVEERRA